MQIFQMRCTVRKRPEASSPVGSSPRRPLISPWGFGFPRAFLTSIAVLIVLGLVFGACGGNGIPDDVEWEVVDSSGRFSYQGDDGIFHHDGMGLRVQVSREVDESVLAAIGEEVRKTHVPEDAPSVVWFFLPGMDPYGYAWGRVETGRSDREDLVDISEEDYKLINPPQ